MNGWRGVMSSLFALFDDDGKEEVLLHTVLVCLIKL